MRQRGRRHNRRILDPHLVVRLVALLQAAQNGNRVFNIRLADKHNLEAPLQRRILLDVLAIFIERCRTDGTQLTTRQRRLQHIRGVDRAFRRACAHQRMQFIDEQDDLPLRIFNLFQHSLETVFKLAAIFCPGKH